MVKHLVQQLVDRTLARMAADGLVPAGPYAGLSLDAPKQAAHGDFASNAAMVLAKLAKAKPRDLATAFVQRLDDPDKLVAKLDIAGPGFLNFTLAPGVWHRVLGEALRAPAEYGRTGAGAGRRVMVEFVSANPTGPMHVGHGRGAVIGDVLCRLLDASGWAVTREYYVNDAGKQVVALARSVWQRLREETGIAKAELGPDDYPGAYVVDVAKRLVAERGLDAAKTFAATPFDEIMVPLREASVAIVLETMIKPTLAKFGVTFDRFFHESQLHQEHAVESALDALEARGAMALEVLPPPKGQEERASPATGAGRLAGAPIEPNSDAPASIPLRVFKSTRFGDDADRPVVNSLGGYTYFAGDIAYHWDKLQRGFARLVNVWGSDHGGYVKRVQSAVEALGGPKGQPEVVLTQLVNLLKDGVPFRMGKRSGNFVELDDVIDEAGVDAARIWFIQRRHDASVDFDVAKAKEQNETNPLFSVQYGHARLASILRKAAEQGVALPTYAPELAAALALPEELDLLRRIDAFPELVAGAAEALEPHRVFFFMHETIGAFHSYYSRYKHTERVIGPDAAKTGARLLLCLALKTTLANALALCGVSAPERMDRAETEA